MEHPSQACTGRLDGSRGSQAPRATSHGPSVTRVLLASCDPHVPPSKPDVRGRRRGLGGVWPGSLWGAPASGGGSHFLPRPPGSPLEMELGERCTNRKPCEGGWRLRLDSSWPQLGQQEWPWPLPWDTGATSGPVLGKCCGPQPSIMGSGQAVIAQ